jgi:hypothetical protein
MAVHECVLAIFATSKFNAVGSLVVKEMDRVGFEPTTSAQWLK